MVIFVFLGDQLKHSAPLFLGSGTNSQLDYFVIYFDIKVQQTTINRGV